MKLIEEEAGLKGKILRPLSARLLPKTEAEKKGFVDREKLLQIRGRSRKPQIKLATEFNIKDYPCPAGGCLLTDKEFANRLRDLFEHRKRVSLADVNLLKLGRHFRVDGSKIIVGRNEAENKTLTARRSKNDYFFEVPDIAGPITLLQGKKTRKAIETASALTAFYSDAKTDTATVNFGREKLDKSMTAKVPTREEVDSLRI
jgi:hypothetical protein